MPSVSDKTDVSTIGHSFKTERNRTPLFHVAKYGDEIIGRELKSQKIARSVVEVEPTTFPTAATDDDKG